MRITFFGSSHGVPEPGRKCSCAMIEVGDNKYLIDLGTNPIDQLIDRGIHPDSINAAFVTHLHGDHFNGIIPYVNLLSWYFKNAKTKFYIPKIEAVDGIRAYLNISLSSNLREDLEFTEITSGCFYDDGVIKVTALRTGHIDVSYAFVVEAEGKSVLFTGDMKHVDGPVADFGRFNKDRTFDLVIAECAHFNGTLYCEPLITNPPKRFIFSHYSEKFLSSCLELKKMVAASVPVTLAADGMIIDV